MKSTKLLRLLTATVCLLSADITAVRSEPVASTDVNESINCSMIQISELLYVYENCTDIRQNKKIRAWIRAKLHFQLSMLESMKLDDKKRQFITKVEQRLGSDR
jgi:hypothetical protein